MSVSSAVPGAYPDDSHRNNPPSSELRPPTHRPNNNSNHTPLPPLLLLLLVLPLFILFAYITRNNRALTRQSRRIRPRHARRQVLSLLPGPSKGTVRTGIRQDSRGVLLRASGVPRTGRERRRRRRAAVAQVAVEDAAARRARRRGRALRVSGGDDEARGQGRCGGP